MKSASLKTVTTLGFPQTTKLVVLEKPSIAGESDNYQEFLNELQSYPCGYWKWLRKRRIREVLVVCSVKNPATGKLDRISIKNKTSQDSIELADGRRFDLKTGRSLSGLLDYIFPVEDYQRVWAAWEPQYLRQRVEQVLPMLHFSDVRSYADLVSPRWNCGFSTAEYDHVFHLNFDRPAGLLSERDAAKMASCRNDAKNAILGHLPAAVQELRALVEMMERDAR
jgi:hypothetical protein